MSCQHTHVSECCLRVTWQGLRIVAQCSECPEYFVRGTLLMHMLHTAPRLYNWPARCVSTDRSNMLLPQTYRRDPSFRFCVCYE